MLNTKFTSLKIFGVTWAIYWNHNTTQLPYTVGSQYKHDSHYQYLYAHCHNARHPQSAGRNHRIIEI